MTMVFVAAAVEREDPRGHHASAEWRDQLAAGRRYSGRRSPQRATHSSPPGY